MEGLTITDIIWDANYFVLDLNASSDKKTFVVENNEFSEKPSRPSKSLVDIKTYKKLLDIKEKIPNCLHWDKWSKLINPYDKVPNLAKNKNNRDYYKFYEIIKYYNLNNELFDITKLPSDYSSGHLGETSFSFVKALTYFIPKINWYSEKVIKSTMELPRAKSFTELNNIKSPENEFENIKDNNGYPRVIISDEKTSFVNNLNNFKDSVGRVDIISADITLDTSHDPNNQEQLLFHLFFAQVVCALNIQKQGGHFIIKIFDCITRPTCQLIYYLTNFYENVSIIKPRTSRYSNAEKYIVAKKFISITPEELINLNNILKNWKDNLYCRVLGIEIPEHIEKMFYNYNQNLINNQYHHIDKIIRCSYSEDDIPEKQLEGYQIKKGSEFCSNFGIPVNLSDSELSTVCKHLNKKKIHVSSLKNCMICEKCFLLVIAKP